MAKTNSKANARAKAKERSDESSVAPAADSPAKRLLRLVLWKPGKQVDRGISFPQYAGEPLDAAEFEAACRRLGVDQIDSRLNPPFEQIIPLLRKSIDIVNDAVGQVSMRYPTHIRSPGLPDVGADKAIRGLPRDDVPPFTLACATALQWVRRTQIEKGVIAQQHTCHYNLEQMTIAAGLRKVPWAADLLNAFIDTVAPPKDADHHAYYARELAVVGDLLMRPGVPGLLNEQSRGHLPRIRPHLANYTPTRIDRARLQAVDEVIAQRQPGQAPEPLFHEITPWARTANAVIARLPKDQFPAFAEICRHASTANPSRVSKDWNTEASRLMSAAAADDDDAPSLRSTLSGLLSAVMAENPFLAKDGADFNDYYERSRENEYRLLGLLCVAGLTGDEPIQNQLAEIVEVCAKVPYRVRYRVQPLATAAMRALSLAPSPPLHLLNRIKLRVKWPPVRKLTPKLVADAAVRSGLDPRDAEETTVPDFGLREGRLSLPVGLHAAADVDATHPDQPTLTWRSKDGRPLKSAAARKADPDAVRSAQRLLKDIQAALPAQRIRHELLLRDTVTWPYDTWRSRYLDHGLLSPMARRLIWSIDGVPALFHGDTLRDVRGKPIKPGKASKVSLWHPISRPVNEVLAWRSYLEELQVTQPFKQAHREVYILTDAERRSRTYSNRFAAHIVKAPALIAVAQPRDWKVSLYGGATLDLPQFNLRAEFWSHEAAGIAETQDRPRSGPPYLSTDQVRFVRAGETDPMPLVDVQPLAFSEVMRDCDFFTSVASVGVDPDWVEGRNPRAREYWEQYSFGDLSETARTRRAVLESLVPRLTRVRDRLSLEERFLVVRGDLRTYKIHLGSGNILMAPNDQYLCIVPDRSPCAKDGAGDVFLPFEGDATLSVILSKAFLLAADATITDPTITRQIRGA